MLQQVPTQIETDPRKYLTCIYGIAGVGKTAFGAQIPGHYFFYTEAGIQGVEVFGDPINSWEDFIGKCTEISLAKQAGWKDEAGNPQREIMTVVVDTYEKLFWVAAAWICANTTFNVKGSQQRFARIEDVPFGKGYTRTSELVLEKLHKLVMLGFGVLVISHAKATNVTWRAQEFQSYGPSLSPSASATLIAACHAVAFFNIEENTTKNEEGQVMQVEEGRYMYWQNSFLITAKHRLPNFPEKLPLPRNGGYKTYLDAFEETVAKLKAEKTETAT